MPNLQSAKKALRKSEANYALNRKLKDRIARWLKKTNTLITEGKKEDALKSYSFYTKLLDKAAKDNVLSKNKASREKSRVQKSINAL